MRRRFSFHSMNTIGALKREKVCRSISHSGHWPAEHSARFAFALHDHSALLVWEIVKEVCRSISQNIWNSLKKKKKKKKAKTGHFQVQCSRFASPLLWSIRPSVSANRDISGLSLVVHITVFRRLLTGLYFTYNYKKLKSDPERGLMLTKRFSLKGRSLFISSLMMMFVVVVVVVAFLLLFYGSFLNSFFLSSSFFFWFGFVVAIVFVCLLLFGGEGGER